MAAAPPATSTPVTDAGCGSRHSCAIALQFVNMLLTAKKKSFDKVKLLKPEHAMQMRPMKRDTQPPVSKPPAEAQPNEAQLSHLILRYIQYSHELKPE